MAYQPIENYGIIGNMHTVALVGMNGSIDWFCYPHFDSPSVFAAILDDKRGGWFKIAPATGGITNKQIYWPETNVLITRFLSADGVGEVVDFMPVGGREGEPGYHQLVRRVSVVRGTMAFRMECYPAFNYARDAHETSLTSDGVLFSALEWSLALSASVSLRATPKGSSSVDIVSFATSSFRGRMVRQAHHERFTRSARPELVEGPSIYFRGNIRQCCYTVSVYEQR